MKKPLLCASAAALFASACASETSSVAAADAVTSDASTPGPRSCPAPDFAGFLRAFASDESVRRANTAPFVQVTEWVDIDETELGTAVERVPREKYDAFKLRRDGDRYLHVEHDDVPEPIAVEPRVTALPEGYRVEYIFNMSEGNSWTFARTQDCWQLVADPDPSLL